MKLSEKGIAKVNGAMVVVRDYSSVGVPIQVIRGANRIKFEPDDFEGGCFQNGKDHIILTVEEAKRLHDCAMFFWSDYEGTQYFTNDDKRFLTDMKERIERAEAIEGKE